VRDLKRPLSVILAALVLCAIFVGSLVLVVVVYNEEPGDVAIRVGLQKSVVTFDIVSFFGSVTPCASRPPQLSIFADYSFRVHHPVNLGDRHLLAHAMASDTAT
jgi:hypothetical protein